MHKTVKKYADNADIKGLKYIFVDCLDADPTFEDYREDFEYCRNLPGLLEDHMELTPFCKDPTGWDEDYWIGLKKDLLKNFSMKRFGHMREVAEVFYKEKVCRIRQEREIKRQQEEAEKRREPQPRQTERDRPHEERRRGAKDAAFVSGSERQKRELEEAKKRLELENQQTERYRRQEEQRRNLERERTGNGRTEAETAGKKALGAVLVILAVLIVMLLITRLQ